MNEYVMIPFKVHEEKLADAKKAISKLISNVREKEPGVLLYKSLQLKEDPTSFVHFIVFSNSDAQMNHRTAKHVLEFIKTLYELCPGEMFPVFMDNFDSCGIDI